MKKLLIPAIAALCFFCLQGCRESTEKQLQKILNSIEIPAEVTGNIDLRESYTVGARRRARNGIPPTPAS